VRQFIDAMIKEMYLFGACSLFVKKSPSFWPIQTGKGNIVEVGCFASAQVVVPNSQQISCLDGSFLECSLPTREARVRSPAGTCQSRDL
jgi:hypothetical protein